MSNVLEQYVVIMCGFFWGLQDVPPKPAQKNICSDVVIASINHGQDTPLMLSIAWHESRFLPNQLSTAGAVGPMQVLPKYWCPKGKAEGCDLVSAGFKAWTTYFEREKGDERNALCRYNSGKKCKHSPGAARYARKVLRTRDNMIAPLYTYWHSRMVVEKCARCPDCCVQLTDNSFVDEYGVERPFDWLPND